MCGIAGILYFDGRSIAEDLLTAMNQAMSHRGPDALGTFVDRGMGLCHHRLSIIDLSTSANQPFADNMGRFVTVFNGEIYNFQEVRNQIKSYNFKTKGDTEVLIASFAEWGIDCLDYLKGMFAFAIWDKEKRELFLARDRVGVKPLYYYKDEEKLIFASEVRTILATNLVKRKINPEAVCEFLTYQSVSYPLTMIQGISQLKAGTWMKIDANGDTHNHAYWNFPVQSKFEYRDIDSVQSKIHTLLNDAICRRLVSDVPIGAFLSGGIDSSIVVGLMAAQGIKPNTFNIAFTEKQFDESGYAELVAKKFNANHTRIQLSSNSLLDNLEEALGVMDTPSGDGVNTYVVSQAIRKAGVTVALSGIGGDELFAGYPIFKQYSKLQQYKSIWPYTKVFRKLMELLLRNSKSNRKSRIGQLLSLPEVSIEYVYPLLRQLVTPRLINHLTKLPFNGGTALSNEMLKSRVILRQLPILSQVSVADLMGYTQHTLLKDTDQMSMAAALEVREPFFDTDLIEYVLGIPDKMKQPTYPKSLLVESVRPLLPDEVVFRKKQGFVFPWSVWLKNELSKFCEQNIYALAKRSFINGDNLIQYWKSFQKENGIRWTDIWLFVVLEYWMEKNGVE